jgi:predicted  nucleic acid-binding Zn-ribbon protein
MQIAMLLDNPEESIEKLEQSLDAAAQKRANLNAKFLAHKEPLEQQLDSFSGINSIKLQKIKERQENVRNVKRAIAEIHEDMKHKVQLQQSLQAELSKMKRTTERSAYTSRIADIIKSIKRQNYDINEILKDTRMLQKSINNVEGQLQRQFTVTEELVWTKVKIRLKYLNFIIF